MTLSVLSAIGVWSKQAHDDPIYSRLSRAIGGSTPDLKVLFRGDGDQSTADFIAQATTTASETGQVLDLTDKLVDFPAGTRRKVKLKYYAQDGEDRWEFAREYTVLGGTTPVITGGMEIQEARGFIAGAAVDYGRVRASYAILDAALSTLNPIGASRGLSLADVSSGNGVITHPIARATNGVRCIAVHFAADVETIGERLHAQIASQTSATTSTLSLATLNGTEAVAAPVDDGELSFELYIEPPPNCFLTMNSNNVEVHISMDASDNVLHTVEVFIGAAEPVPFQA